MCLFQKDCIINICSIKIGKTLMDFVTIAAGVVKLLQPALPYLDPLKTALQKKITDATAGAAWDQAKALWAKITGCFKDDKELNEAADAVATAPDKEIFQRAAREELTKVLAERLKDSPELAKELLELLGGEEKLNEIVAGDEAIIESNRQALSGKGTNRIEAGNKARITGNTQEITP